VVEKFEPQVVRNVISKETCQTLLDVLEGVVSEGTGRNAYVKGYRWLERQVLRKLMLKECM